MLGFRYEPVKVTVEKTHQIFGKPCKCDECDLNVMRFVSRPVTEKREHCKYCRVSCQDQPKCHFGHKYN